MKSRRPPLRALQLARRRPEGKPVSTALDAYSNAMGMAGAQAFGDMLLVNKTIQTLDVSDNSFGKMQVGDQVKIKSSGETAMVSQISTGNGGLPYSDGSGGVQVNGTSTSGLKPSEFEWGSQVPAFCAGLAASPSLISVSTIF